MGQALAPTNREACGNLHLKGPQLKLLAQTFCICKSGHSFTFGSLNFTIYLQLFLDIQKLALGRVDGDLLCSLKAVLEGSCAL